MTKFILKSFVLVALLMVPRAAMAEGIQIIVFDPDVALAASDVGQDIAKQLKEQSDDMRTRVQAEAVELENEAGKLREQQTLLSPDALQQRVEELQARQVSAQQQFTTEGQGIQAGGQVASREVLKIIDEELDKISKDRKVDIVMNRKAVFYASPAIDVTKELVERINQRITSIKVTPVKPQEAQ